MIQYLITSTYLVVLSYIGFYLLKKQFPHRQNLINVQATTWYVLIITAFLSQNYWIFVFFSTAFLTINIRKQQIDVALPVFIISLLALPTLSKEIPGIGSIRYLLELNWPRIVVFLIPFLLYFRYRNLSGHPSKTNTDRLVLFFSIYVSLLAYRETSFTEGSRHVIYTFLQIYIPYIAISRLATDITTIDSMLIAILSASVIMSIIAVYETITGWHPYAQLIYSLETKISPLTAYKYRSGFLRAYAAHGSIPLGIYITIAYAALLYLQQAYKPHIPVWIVHFLLGAGLIVTFSRGPWVGFFILIMLYYLFSINKTRFIPYIFIGIIASYLTVNFTEFGQRLFQLLPFIGTDEEGNISYRQRLLTTSIKVINQHPLFGTKNVLEHPDMQTLIQGEGIIDVVNTYLQIALQYGYIGLFLFIAIYLTLIKKLFTARRFYKSKNDTQNITLSTIFIAGVMSTMFMIGTVGILTDPTITIYIFSYLGLISAYLRTARNGHSHENT